MDMAQILLDRNADINCKNGYGDTPLHLAVDHMDMDMAQILLDRNADVNSRNGYGDTPLHLAVKNKDNDMTQILLERNSDVNCSNRSGITPLHLAVDHIDKEMAQILIDRNANVNCSNSSGYTPLLSALKNNDKEMAQMLLDRNADVNSRDREGRIPLHLAIAEDNLNMTQFLLDKKYDLNSLRYWLDYAISSGALLIAKDLLKRGSESGVLIPSNYFSTNSFVLHKACSSRCSDMIYFILSKFSTKLETYRIINLTDRDGNTPLHLYCKFRNFPDYEDAEFLLINSANVNIENNEGYTLIRQVCSCPIICLDSLKLLFDNGAEIKVGLINLIEQSLNSMDVACSLYHHVIRLRQLNLYVDPAVLHYFRTNFHTDTIFENDCKNEINRMKNISGIGTHHSCYSLLIQNNHLLARCLNNKRRLVKIETSEEYRNKFSIYGGMLFSKLKKAEIRMELLNVLDNYCYILFPTLPLECIEIIFSYLSEMEILALIDAVSK